MQVLAGASGLAILLTTALAAADAPPPSSKAPASPRQPAPLKCSRAWQTERRQKPPAGLPRLPAKVSLDVATWPRQQAAGIAWQQPPGVFAVRPRGDGAELWTELVVDAPHGESEPGDETRQWFRAAFHVIPRGFAATVCEHLTFMFDAASPKGIKLEDSAERRMVGGQPAWVFGLGAHGYEDTYVLVELGPERTGLLVLSTVGSVLFRLLPQRQQALAEQQHEIFMRLLDTIKFSAK